MSACSRHGDVGIGSAIIRVMTVAVDEALLYYVPTLLLYNIKSNKQFR